MFRNIRWKWHLSCLEKMIRKNQNLETTDKFKYHLRKFQQLNSQMIKRSQK